MSMRPVEHWRLHLGAHKTATTHLQHRIAALRGPLLEAGLDAMVPAGQLRPLSLHRIVKSPGRLWRWRRPKIERLTGPLSSLRQGAEKVLASEELMMGPLVDVVAAGFYGPVGPLAAIIGELTKTASVHLFLGVRSYDTFLPSLYAQSLRHKAPPPGRFPAMLNAFNMQSSGWADIVDQLASWAPRATLTMWRYEDYRDNADSILDAVCGVRLPAMPDIAVPDYTRSGSGESVAAAEQLASNLTDTDRKAAVSALYNDPALAGPSFNPLTADQRSALQARYVRDLDTIARKHPGVLMRFP